MCGFLDLNRRNLIFLADLNDELACQNLFICKCEERVHEMNVVLCELLDVVLDVLRVGGDHRAVIMVAGLRGLIALVRDTRIKDLLDSLTDQPADVTVNDLCRVALGLTRDRLNAKFVDLSRGLWGEHGAETKLLEKDSPERVVLVHVKHARDSDCAMRCLILRQRLVVEHTVILVVEKVRDLLAGFLLAESAFTAVSADELATTAETVDCQNAVVRTSLASRHRSVVFERKDLVEREHRGSL